MEILAVGALAGVVAFLIYSHRLMRKYSVPEPGPDEGRAALSVVVAAHNEAPRVARLITSLLAQDHPDFEVILVADRSVDGTAEVAREAAGSDPRFRVIEVEERPAGWQGRLYAQGVGGRLARGEWLLFLSGDQELRSSSFLRSMVALYEHSDVAGTAVVGPFTGERWWHRWWFNPMLNNPLFWGVVFAIQERVPSSPWLIGALGIQRQHWAELGGSLAAASCGAGGFDEWGWCQAFRQRGERARTVYHPALEDASNWTDFHTFWHGFTRWQAGIFTYRRGGWIAAGAMLAAICFILIDSCQALAALLAGGGVPLSSLALAGISLAIGISYCRSTGERWWFAFAFHLVGFLLVASIVLAVWARLRNRVAWREDVISIIAAPPDEWHESDSVPRTTEVSDGTP